MSYTIKEFTTKGSSFATMKMTIPDYSRALHKKAIASMIKDLGRQGIELTDEPYNFSISYDVEDRIELVDIEFFVRVKSKGTDSDIIKFRDIDGGRKMIRVLADAFEDVHTGLAEWMHDNDFMAGGTLRQVVSDEAPYVFDSPITDAED